MNGAPLSNGRSGYATALAVDVWSRLHSMFYERGDW